jgi:hypothetical protein
MEKLILPAWSVVLLQWSVGPYHQRLTTCSRARPTGFVKVSVCPSLGLPLGQHMLDTGLPLYVPSA